MPKLGEGYNPKGVLEKSKFFEKKYSSFQSSEANVIVQDFSRNNPAPSKAKKVVGDSLEHSLKNLKSQREEQAL